MSRTRKQDSEVRPDPATKAFVAGLQQVFANPALNSVQAKICREQDCRSAPEGGLATVSSNGTVHAHRTKHADPATWAWSLAHCIIHLGFGHVPAAKGERTQPDRYDLAARCAVVNRFLLTFPIGRAPEDLPASYPGGDEEQMAAGWRRDGAIPAAYRNCGTAGGRADQILRPWHDPWNDPPDWQEAFARALTGTMSKAMDMAGGLRDALDGRPTRRAPWDHALNWFVSSYPLLGAIAAGMTLVADAELARAHHISVAAVNAAAAEIYINPLVRLGDEEWRFVLAHEMLHAALRHADRCGARDPYLFNVAADYVINAWLCEMDVGVMPQGALFDPQLSGLSTEEVYDRIAGDLRRIRRLATLRGKGLGDVLGEPITGPAHHVDLDEYYRRGLAQGFDLHQARERGTLPAGLVEEIKALSQPPLAWDAQLAQWFDEFVPRPEPVRSYARPARRQASTPDIPRAGRYFPPEEIRRCTFGVVLDTSASMSRTLLGKGLGAIASFATARDVPAARVVFCDAAPHDAGYLPVTDIAEKVRVRGRGGTALQPGIDLLHRAEDFPPDAPVLVITDGGCDVLRIRREHAFLLRAGGSLPFTPKGPVFRVT
ncbi:hypothetical protein G6045_16665 [Streptomyces sp. YC504]|uniref:Putative metallopeptidase domain-containing protein n=1 Tax=Streptomyces mesophilus TaxID=1775132 RepID=A0A6G4XIP1_9ACTN|nr:hypothetical protein [Streptomyces mesophilus]NGO77278.1 hypothetical protein [Streptomyces mesophilus]